MIGFILGLMMGTAFGILIAAVLSADRIKDCTKCPYYICHKNQKKEWE